MGRKYSFGLADDKVARVHVCRYTRRLPQWFCMMVVSGFLLPRV